MKTEIGSYEAKTRLPELLRSVQKGQSYTITNRGRTVAMLVPAPDSASVDPAVATERMKSFMQSGPVRGIDIKALREEGRA